MSLPTTPLEWMELEARLHTPRAWEIGAPETDVLFLSDLESQKDCTQHLGLPEAVTPRLRGPIVMVPGWEEPWL